MRFIHTADWHLGRLFHGVHLTDDQAHLLDQFVDFARSAGPDAILIAGDIYDRAVPPPEAVELLSDVLCQLAIEVGAPILLIAGNHDSPQRLGFGQQLFARQQIHIAALPAPRVQCLTLHDNHGPVDFFAIPYAEPAVMRQCFEDPQILDHDSAMRCCIRAIEESCQPGRRRVLMGHAFVSGGSECESERPLSVGGAGTIDAACFAGFHYVALGHLHAPQAISNGTVRYSGSLMKYSFSECDQRKVIHLVEMDAAGACRVEDVPLTPRRDVRRIQGRLEDLLKAADGQPIQGREDYIQFILDDTGALLDPMGKLRAIYPNALEIQRPQFSLSGPAADRLDHTRTTPIELFSAFFRQVAGTDITPEQAAAFAGAVETMHQEEREVLA